MLPAPGAVITCKTRLLAPGADIHVLLLNACASVKKRANLPALKECINTAKFQTTMIVVNPVKKSILLEETRSAICERKLLH